MNTPRRLLSIAALALSLAPASASAQTATIDVPAGASQTITLQGPYRIQYADRMLVVTFGDVGPGPGPNPGPGPGPRPDPPVPPVPPPDPPTPVARGKLWVSLLYDDATETQDQAAVRAALSQWPGWAELDARFTAYVATQEVVQRYKLRPGEDVLFPAVLIQDQVGGQAVAPIVKTLNVVDSADGVIAAVKALRGKP